MTKLKLFNNTVCEVMNLAGGKCLVRDCKGEEFEVYSYELQDIPLSKELLEYLGFRFDREDDKIKNLECYKLTKINRVYFTGHLQKRVSSINIRQSEEEELFVDYPSELRSKLLDFCIEGFRRSIG